jgi:opacity protein-like surface antigen
VKKFLISAAVLICMGSAAYAADEEPPPEAPPPGPVNTSNPTSDSPVGMGLQLLHSLC